MLELIFSIPLAILILAASHEAGRLVLRIFRIGQSRLSMLEFTLLRCALGLIAIEFIITILGWAHLLYRPVLWILFIALLLSAFISGRNAIIGTIKSRIEFVRETISLPLNAVLAILVGVALLMDFILTCVPTTAWDALTYHYPLPAIWLSAHGFIPRLDICYSELPCANEMLFAFAFGLGGIGQNGMGVGHLVANHLTWAAGLFSVLAMIAVSKRLGDTIHWHWGGIWNPWTPGLIAALAYLSLPIIFVEEMEGGYVENFIVYFSLEMLIVFLEFRERNYAPQLIIIGILAGGLLASKHTNLFHHLIILSALVVWIIGAKDPKPLWKALGWAVLIAIIIPLPWYLKSYMDTGDPFWPFLSKILHPDAPLPNIMYWSNPNIERSLWGFITYIPRLTWDESLVQIKFRLLSWYFLPLLPFAIYKSLHSSNARVTAIIAWTLIMIIYLLAPGEPRYLLVAWVLYALLGAWGLLQVLHGIPWSIKYVLPLLLIIPIAFSLVERTGEVNRRIPTIIGMATVDDYFEKSLDIWPLIRYINEETGPDEGVVMVEPRIFYLQRPYIVWYPFPTPPTKDWDRIELSYPGGLYYKWQHLGMKNLMLTYGPNYRAIAIAHSQASQLADEGRTSSFFSDIPKWVYRRASNAEQDTSLDENGYLEINESRLDERWGYDVKSMSRIAEIFAGRAKLYYDPRAGMIYRLPEPIWPRSDE